MTDLMPVIFMIAFVLFLNDNKIIVKLENFRNSNMIRKIYLFLLIIGGIFCLLSNIFKIDLSILFYCWAALAMILNFIAEFICLKFIKYIDIKDIVFGIISILLLITTCMIFFICVNTNEKDLSGMLLLIVGSGMTSFAFMFSIYNNYGLNNS